MTKIKRQTRRMWWDIKDIAFFGANITRRNGMFMSISNSIPVGSIYDTKKNIFGILTDENLVYSQESLKNHYINYPKIITDSAGAPTSFKLDTSNETGIEILSSIIDSSNIANINAEISSLLKNADSLIVKIDEWGIDYIQEGELAVFLAQHSDERIEQILDGDNYVATRGIWVEGFKISYGLDSELILRIKNLIEANKEELIQAKLDIEIKSDLSLDLSINFDGKFYPFFKFRKIHREKKQDYYYLASADKPENDIFLDDVNLTEYTV